MRKESDRIKGVMEEVEVGRNDQEQSELFLIAKPIFPSVHNSLVF